MAEPGQTELGQIESNYRRLVGIYPVDKFPPTSKSSLPDWEVKKEEREWARLFLLTGDNSQVLENFSKYSGYVSKRGLQLLRDSSVDLTSFLRNKLKQNTNEHLLLRFLRSRFQTDALYFEEGLRGARNIDNQFWNNEEDGELLIARNSLKISNSAFRQMEDFSRGRTNKLSSVSLFIETEYKAAYRTANGVENFMRMYSDQDGHKNKANVIAEQGSSNLVFWSSLKSFVDNLELSRQQK